MMFYECLNLTSLDISNFNTPNAENMGGIFGKCLKLSFIDIFKSSLKKLNNSN